MKKVFLTGATGVMGFHGLRHLMAPGREYEVTVLARDSRKNRRKLEPYIRKGVKVIWGDLLDPVTVAEGVSSADIVLHVGGMVSPAADWQPEKTIKTNTESMRLIIEAARKSNPDVRVVYIGSVAQYGNYAVPNHWGQVGDPLNPAFFDAYAYSKVMAERMLMESGLSHWVSLRQTGILHSGLLMKAEDPIAFHVPVRGVLEWVTAEDSGRLLERVCRDSVPDSFWNKCYNIGGGAAYRMTNYEFEARLMKAMGCPTPEKVFDVRWFATGNFHGCWYKDSDTLDEILHFRSGVTPDEYFRQMKRELPWYFSLAPLAPAFALKAFMRRVANTPKLGPMWWISQGKTERIDAAWGGLEKWCELPEWNGTDLSRPSDEVSALHTVETKGDPDEVKTLVCPDCGAVYNLRARTVAAGHGCPECLLKRL